MGSGDLFSFYRHTFCAQIRVEIESSTTKICMFTTKIGVFTTISLYFHALIRFLPTFTLSIKGRTMMTFFSILLVLIAINAVLMIFSLNNAGHRSQKIDKDSINNVISKTYRINFTSSKYEEVV